MLIIAENNAIEPGIIYEFTSEQKFDDNDRIVMNKNLGKNSLYEFTVLNNDNKILDTEENKKMIENDEIIDFSKITKTDYIINEYIIKSISKGCEFYLESNVPIKENNESIKLNFYEKDNINNNMSINCILTKENKNNISCYLEPEVNNNYTLDSYIGYNKEGIFYIFQEKEESFQLVCKSENKEEEKDKKLNIKIIIIIACAIVVIIIAIIVIIIICCKKKETDKGTKIGRQITVPNNDPNMDISFSNPSEKGTSGRKNK